MTFVVRWVEEAVHDEKQHRRTADPHGTGQRDVDRGVLQRGQAAVQDGLGESAGQVAAAGK